MSNLIIPRSPRYQQGLVALYHADHSRHDRSLYSNDLLEENALVPYRTTQYGRAFDFTDGVGTTPDYLYAPDHPSLDITGPLTIVVLAVKDSGSVANAGLISKYGGAGSWTNQRSYVLNTLEQSTAPRQLSFRVSDDGTFAGSEAVNSSTTTITYGEPFAVIATYVPGEKLRLNVDGVVTENTTAIPSSIHSGTAPLMIGHQFDDTSENLTWDGGIMLAAVFNRAWTPAEEMEFIVDPLGLVRQQHPPIVMAEVATSASPVIIPGPPRSTSFSEVRGLSAKGLTLGLTSAGVLDGKGQPFDLVANEFLTPYSDAVPTVPTTEGMALEPGTGTTRSGDAYTIDHLGSNWLDGAAEFTLGVIWRYEGTDDTDEDSLIGRWNRVQGADSLDARRALLRYDNDATSSLDLFVTDSASSIVSIQANFDLDDGEFHWLVGRYDGANLQVFVDGQSIGTPTAFTGTVSSAAASFVPEVFGGQLVTSGGGTDSPRGQFKGWFISERAWTDAEIRDWYEPTTRWEWVDTGGPLIMAETAAPPAGSAPVYLFHNRHHNRSA